MSNLNFKTLIKLHYLNVEATSPKSTYPPPPEIVGFKGNPQGYSIQKVVKFSSSFTLLFLFGIVLLFGIFFSCVAQAQWSALNSGTTYNLEDVYFLNSTTGYAVGWRAGDFKGFILKTTDAGATWNVTDSTASTSMSLYDIHFFDSNTGYIAGYYILLKTEDGGASWQDVAPDPNQGYYSVFSPDEFITYATTVDGLIYKTINGGISWTQQSSGTGNPLNAIHMVSPDSGIAVGGASFGTVNITKTTDGGSNWQFTSLGGSFGDLYDISMPNETTAYAVGNASRKTTDFGVTWNFVNNPIVAYGIDFIDADTGYVVGDNGYVLRTVDGGDNFCFQSSYTTTKLNAVFFVNDTVGYAVGNNGTIIKTTNAGIGCPVSSFLPQADTSVCIGSSVNFTDMASGTESYTWQEDGITFSTSQNPTRTFNTVGTYTISYIVGKNCEGCSNDTSSIVVTVNPLPTADAGVNDTICSGDTTQLNATGGVSYNWIPATGLSNPNIANPMANPTSTTTYFITVTDANGCSAQDNVKIVINPTPTLSITPDTLHLCPGDNGILTANPQSGSIVYAWFNQSFDSVGTGNTLLVDTAGKYYASNIDTTTGCYNTDSSMVIIHQVYNVPNATAICFGDSISLQGAYQTTAGTYYDTLATINGCDSVIVTTLMVNNSTSSSQSYTACESYLWNGKTYTVSGTFTDTIPNAVGCDSIMTLNLTINPLPNVTLALNPDTVCVNAAAYSLTGGSPGGGSYSGIGIIGGNFDPATAGSGTHNITYTYTDANTCTDSATAQIVVEVCTGISSFAGKDNSIVIYPNPNDGTFTLQLISESAEQYTLQIINITGQVVQEQNITAVTGENKIIVSMDNTGKGVFFVKVKGERNNIGKIVIVE